MRVVLLEYGLLKYNRGRGRGWCAKFAARGGTESVHPDRVLLTLTPPHPSVTVLGTILVVVVDTMVLVGRATSLVKLASRATRGLAVGNHPGGVPSGAGYTLG